MQNATSKNKSNRIIRYHAPIIGYSRDFWDECQEDKERVAALEKKNSWFMAKMMCKNHHIYHISPYSFFYLDNRCPHCIKVGEIGAVNLDETIRAFWNDDRFELDSISESSSEKYYFTCPFCGEHFESRMTELINQTPKCKKCHDGQSFSGSIYQASDKSKYWIN